MVTVQAPSLCSLAGTHQLLPFSWAIRDHSACSICRAVVQHCPLCGATVILADCYPDYHDRVCRYFRLACLQSIVHIVHTYTWYVPRM